MLLGFKILKQTLIGNEVSETMERRFDVDRQGDSMTCIDIESLSLRIVYASMQRGYACIGYSLLQLGRLSANLERNNVDNHGRVAVSRP
jgi:hypothetical protein